MKNTGKVVIGSVHDCNKKELERLLKNYDRFLYLKWNPDKNGGLGVWELRRKPESKTAVPKWEYNGEIVFSLESVEYDWLHHVMDLPVLHYGILDRLRSMDMWRNPDHLIHDLEYHEDKSREAELQKNKDELRYQMRHNKRAIKDFYELVRSGRNPADLLAGDW